MINSRLEVYLRVSLCTVDETCEIRPFLDYYLNSKWAASPGLHLTFIHDGLSVNQGSRQRLTSCYLMAKTNNNVFQRDIMLVVWLFHSYRASLPPNIFATT